MLPCLCLTESPPENLDSETTRFPVPQLKTTLRDASVCQVETSNAQYWNWANISIGPAQNQCAIYSSCIRAMFGKVFRSVENNSKMRWIYEDLHWIEPIFATEKEKETCEYEKIGRGLCWILGINFSWLLCLTKHLKSEGESRPGHTQRHFYLGILQWCNLFALSLGLFVKEWRLPSLKVKHATMALRSKSFQVYWLWLVRRINSSRTWSGNWEVQKHDITWKPWPANMYAVYLSVLFVSPYH